MVQVSDSRRGEYFVMIDAVKSVLVSGRLPFSQRVAMAREPRYTGGGQAG
jgi:hypothetical protein